MPWWGWIILGALLFGAEIMGIDAAFFLIFIGISAVLVGLAELLGAGMPFWGELLAFALISIISMVLFRQRIYSMVRSNAKGVDDNIAGQSVELTEDLAPGDTSRVNYRGTTWKVVNVGATVISSGSQAVISEVDGTTLKIS